MNMPNTEKHQRVIVAATAVTLARHLDSGGCRWPKCPEAAEALRDFVKDLITKTSDAEGLSDHILMLAELAVAMTGGPDWGAQDGD